MSIVEQRKAILPDGHGKSDEEVKLFLESLGFNMKREYSALRGQTATVFIQDINPTTYSEPKKKPTISPQLQEKLVDLAEEAIHGPSGKMLTAIMHLLKDKLVRKETLTPIELLVARFLAEGIKDTERVMGENDGCDNCGEHDE